MIISRCYILSYASVPGTGHQPVLVSTLGACFGTGPFQGARPLSTAFRGMGEITAPCASANSTRRTHGAKKRRRRGRSTIGEDLWALNGRGFTSDHLLHKKTSHVASCRKSSNETVDVQIGSLCLSHALSQPLALSHALTMKSFLLLLLMTLACCADARTGTQAALRATHTVETVRAHQQGVVRVL